MNENENLHYSKKGHRQVTPFIGQELLYDFVSQRLDVERTEAVKDFVAASEEAQADIQKIKNAITYLGQLSQTTADDLIIEEIKMPSSYFDVLLKKLRFDDWPDGIKMAIEISIVSLGVISVVLVCPGTKSWKLILAKIVKSFWQRSTSRSWRLLKPRSKPTSPICFLTKGSLKKRPRKWPLPSLR
jgi:hypothetical protein